MAHRGWLHPGRNLLAKASRRAAQERAQAAFSVGAVVGTRIVLARPDDVRADRHRGYRIFVDDRPAGMLLAGRTVEVPVEPGRHRVQLRVDWLRSRKLVIDLAADDVARLQVRPRTPWAWPFWVTLGIRRYPRLRHASPPGAEHA